MITRNTRGFNGSASQPHTTSTPIYVPGRAAPVGYVHGSTFCKNIRGSVHMLRSPRAIAFDLSTLDDAEAAGAICVGVFDSETGKTYTALIADVRRYGFPVVRGFGNQVALTLDRYSIDGQQPEAERRAAALNDNYTYPQQTITFAHEKG